MHDEVSRETAVTAKFLEAPNEDSFTDVFNIFSPQLIAFFRARSCKLSSAEDLAQEVMLTVYRKSGQIRHRDLFRAWLFKIARNALWRHRGKQTREADTVHLGAVAERVLVARRTTAGTPSFEFHNWMALLESHEREVMTLRFVEEWEYQEIAEARATPIGTVKWWVHNAKKKLVRYLTAPSNVIRETDSGCRKGDTFPSQENTFAVK